MKFQAPSLLPGLLALLISASLPGNAFAYDVPVFHDAPFDRDGIFLEDGDRQSLLEALASIACNFPGSSSVDEDLIEKALGLALTIDPFHGNSRRAHEKLAAGDTPEATQFFDSRSAVAEALWGVAIQLVAPPVEPEAKRLAPLLMEISLLIHPAPTTERIVLLDQWSGGKDDLWKGFVSLQKDVFASNERLQYLKREARTARKEVPSISPAKKAASMPKSDPETEAPPARPTGMTAETAPIDEEQRSLSGVFSNPTGSATGTFTLRVRAPAAPEEAERFPFLTETTAKNYPYLPVFPAGDVDLPMIGERLIGDKVEAYGITWPQGAVGEAGFESSLPLPDDENVGGIPVSLPLILSLKSISESRDLNPSIGVIGSYDQESSSFLSISDPVELIVESRSLGKAYVLIQSDTLPALLENLLESENLEPLFFSELLSFETLEEAYDWVTLSGIPAAMTEASGIFAEIQSVSARMPLPDLARNVKVQERLERILELVPGHYSARAMLEFGRSPVSDRAHLKTAIAGIDVVIDPYFALRNEFGADTINLRNEVDAADQELSRLRTEVPVEARNYHSLAEDMIDAAGIYLGVSNKTTSIAEQRLRELKALLDQLDSEREVLGLGLRSEAD